MSTTILPIARQNLAVIDSTVHTQKSHRLKGLQRKFVKMAKTARWLRKAGFTYDYMNVAP